MNSKREIRKMQPLLKKVNALRSKYQQFSDEELKLEAAKLKERRQKESQKLLHWCEKRQGVLWEKNIMMSKS